MKKIFISLVTIITTISLTTVGFASSVSQLKGQLDANDKEIAEKKDQIEQIKGEQKDLLAQIEELGIQINKLQSEISSLNTQISNCNAEIEVKEDEIEQKEVEMDEQYELLKTRIVAMYKTGNISALDVFLGSESLSDFLSKYHAMSKIAEYDNKLLDKILKQKEQIELLKEQLEEKKAELNSDKQQVQTKSNALSSSKSTLTKKNAELESNKTALNNSIDKILEESAKLTAEIMRLQGTGSYAGGEMAWPLPGFSKITSPYGMRLHPTLKVYKLHTGVDIAGSGCNGKPIVAANSGKVISAGWNTAYGNRLIIDHGGGISTLYAHASKLVVKQGDIVTRGQTIAYVGSTGYSTGPHLHFEVRINGSTTDPLPYIQ